MVETRSLKAILSAILLIGLLIALSLPAQAQVSEYTLEQGPFQGIVEERPTGSEFVSDTGLMLSWDMETLVSGEMRDFSPEGNTGVLTGTTDSAGIMGQARNFDGVDDSVQDATNPAFLDNSLGTMAAWVSLADLITPHTILSASVTGSTDDEFYVTFRGDQDNELEIWLLVNSLTIWNAETGDNLITDATWHHVAVTSDSTTVRLYFNGVEQPLTDVTGTNNGQWFGSATDADTFTAGGLQRATLLGDFEGDMDEIPVLDRTLSDAQVAYLANHRNYTFRFNTTVPDVVSTGPTWVQGDALTIGVAVNDSTTLFTLNATRWEASLFEWESYANLSAITVRYNFTFPSGTYPLFVNEVFEGSLTTDINGNMSFNWTEWGTTNLFRLGIPPAVLPGAGPNLLWIVFVLVAIGAGISIAKVKK